MLGAAAVVRAIAARGLFPWLGAIVEPLRDELVSAIVATTLQRAVAGEPSDLASVARLTGQVDTVRNLVSATLRTIRQVTVTIFASLTGLLVRAPAAVAISLPPVLAGLALYRALLPTLTRRQYALLDDEQIAAETTTALVAVRDIVACGAEPRVGAAIGSQVDAQAAAARALAWAGAARRMIVALGGELPVVLVLAAGPWFTHHASMTVGDLASAAIYLALNLLPAIRSLVATVGTWGLQLAVVLGRLEQATIPPSQPPVATNQRPAPDSYKLQIHGASFAYGPRSEPIIHKFKMCRS